MKKEEADINAPKLKEEEDFKLNMEVYDKFNENKKKEDFLSVFMSELRI